ncbi:hypothetical protein LCGC14_2858360 [marine sediment metagenome]|uniref:Uncharacterized protein n=1 Tax=marine sediment metagenome TaxID=412755 RepID=A0A0F8Y6P2_9ZZZZ
MTNMRDPQVTGLWIIAIISATITIFVIVAEPAPIITVYNPDGIERVTTIVCRDESIVAGIPTGAKAIGNQAYLSFADNYALALDKLPSVRMGLYTVFSIEDGVIVNSIRTDRTIDPCAGD